MKRPRVVARLIDLRAGETRIALLSFLVLMLTSAGYTVLETARDALLVTRLPQRDFGFAYIAVAAFALPAASLLARVARSLDPRRVLLGLLLLAAIGSLAFTALPIRRAVVVAFYVTVGLVSSSVFPQFWVLVGTSLTVGQSRRLIGPIASAGVFGAVVGASSAAAMVPWLPVRGLVALGAAMLATAAGAVFFVASPPPRRAPPVSGGAATPIATSMSAFRQEPFLLRVAVLVAPHDRDRAGHRLLLQVDDRAHRSRSPRAAPSSPPCPTTPVVNIIALVVQIFVGSAIVQTSQGRHHAWW